MNTRIKELRKHLKLTQAEFGARVGVNNSTISSYESGHRAPSGSVILSICRGYGVSEAWLRTGEGEMFSQRIRNEDIAILVNDILSGEDDSFRNRFIAALAIAALAELGPDQWQALEDSARKLIGQ